MYFFNEKMYVSVVVRKFSLLCSVHFEGCDVMNLDAIAVFCMRFDIMKKLHIEFFYYISYIILRI